MLQMEQAHGLNHILGKWMSLPALQTAMRRAGVNVFVNEYSDTYVTVSAKVITLLCLYSRLHLNKSWNIFMNWTWTSCQEFPGQYWEGFMVISLGPADRARSVRADGLSILSFCFVSESVERSVRTGASRTSGTHTHTISGIATMCCQFFSGESS